MAEEKNEVMTLENQLARIQGKNDNLLHFLVEVEATLHVS
jgi:hypothetical protein